jgi:hypothetical protein
MADRSIAVSVCRISCALGPWTAISAYLLLESITPASGEASLARAMIQATSFSMLPALITSK